MRQENTEFVFKPLMKIKTYIKLNWILNKLFYIQYYKKYLKYIKTRCLGF